MRIARIRKINFACSSSARNETVRIRGIHVTDLNSSGAAAATDVSAAASGAAAVLMYFSAASASVVLFPVVDWPSTGT